MGLFDNYKTFLKDKYNYDVKCDDAEHVKVGDLEKMGIYLEKDNIKQAVCTIMIKSSEKLITILTIRRLDEGEKEAGKRLMYLIGAVAVDLGYTVTFTAVPLAIDRYNLSYAKQLEQLTKYYNKIGFQRINQSSYKTSPQNLETIIKQNMATKGGKKTRKMKIKKRKSYKKTRKH